MGRKKQFEKDYRERKMESDPSFLKRLRENAMLYYLIHKDDKKYRKQSNERHRLMMNERYRNDSEYRELHKRKARERYYQKKGEML